MSNLYYHFSLWDVYREKTYFMLPLNICVIINLLNLALTILIYRMLLVASGMLTVNHLCLKRMISLSFMVKLMCTSCF